LKVAGCPAMAERSSVAFGVRAQTETEKGLLIASCERKRRTERSAPEARVSSRLRIRPSHSLSGRGPCWCRRRALLRGAAGGRGRRLLRLGGRRALRARLIVLRLLARFVRRLPCVLAAHRPFHPVLGGARVVERLRERGLDLGLVAELVLEA